MRNKFHIRIITLINELICLNRSKLHCVCMFGVGAALVLVNLHSQRSRHVKRLPSRNWRTIPSRRLSRLLHRECSTRRPELSGSSPGPLQNVYTSRPFRCSAYLVFPSLSAVPDQTQRFLVRPLHAPDWRRLIWFLQSALHGRLPLGLLRVSKDLMNGRKNTLSIRIMQMTVQPNVHKFINNQNTNRSPLCRNQSSYANGAESLLS